MTQWVKHLSDKQKNLSLNIKPPFKRYNTSHRHSSYSEIGDRDSEYVEVHQLANLVFAVVSNMISSLKRWKARTVTYNPLTSICAQGIPEHADILFTHAHTHRVVVLCLFMTRPSHEVIGLCVLHKLPDTLCSILVAIVPVFHKLLFVGRFHQLVIPNISL